MRNLSINGTVAEDISITGDKIEKLSIDGSTVWQSVGAVIATGTIGTNGAPWTLYADGRVMVRPGRIHWNHGTRSPWEAHEDIVTEIVFSGSGYTISQTRSLFANLMNLHTISGMDSWNMSDVTIVRNMFRDTHSLVDLDLSAWDTSNVSDFGTMFTFGGVHSLDLSGWDTRSRTTMSSTFQDASNLSKIVLGEHFGFETNARLVTVPNNAEFTGFWQNVGSGTSDNPQGVHILTSAQLMATYDGSAMADTWVWQRRA